MKVFFENSDKKYINIGECNDLASGLNIIMSFLDEHKFKSYYQRISEIPTRNPNNFVNPSIYWIDVGSYTEFFWIVNKEEELGGR